MRRMWRIRELSSSCCLGLQRLSALAKLSLVAFVSRRRRGPSSLGKQSFCLEDCLVPIRLPGISWPDQQEHRDLALESLVQHLLRFLKMCQRLDLAG